MSNDLIVKAENVNKSFRHGKSDVEVLKGVNLEVRSGEQVAITGASGSGKSTLLHLLGTLDDPTSGNIFINGVNISGLAPADLAALRNKKLGFVFQFHHLLPELTALENVMLPGSISGTASGELIPRAEALLSEVGLSNRMTHKPGELSGGEQQRVSLARALMMKPMLILADEITGNLDRKTGRNIFDLLKKVSVEHGTTMLFVTHDTDLAKEFPRLMHLVDGVLRA